MMEGIQIIGTQRSGSNLLRVMLNESPDISAPHPPHILSTFAPLLSMYAPNTYEQLVRDVVDYVQCNPVPWEGIKLNADEIIHESNDRNLFELFKLVYEKAALAKGARYWCCKSMVNFKYAAQLEQNNIAPKYVFIYRDGRDLALSFKKAVVGEKHTYHIASQWKQDQAHCLRLKEQTPQNRFYAIRYEDLIQNPEEELQNVCRFLDISYSSQMMSYHQSSSSLAAAQSGKMWTNLTKPVIKTNSGKFLTEISKHELEVFELVAGDILEQLGYSCVTNRDDRELLSTERIAQYDEKNKQMKKEVELASPDDMEKRKAQSQILKNIRERAVVAEEPALIGATVL